MDVPVALALALTLALCAVAPAGCGGDTRKTTGSVCTDDSDCASGICGAGACLDPTADTDGDDLLNALEARLGSSPVDPDTDHDGRPDGSELSDDSLANTDADDDGKADILESAILDGDGDCIPDQFDARDAVPSDDLSPMREVVCATQGLCAGQPRAAFGVTCATGVAVCVYDRVPGYASPETLCDGLDQNCDGVADGNFPDRDGDQIADCIDVDWDNDGTDDALDVCPTVADPTQADGNGDGLGDACASRYRLVFREAPTHVVVGHAFAARVACEAPPEDIAAGAPIPSFRGLVTLTIADGTHSVHGPSGAATAVASAGIATFSALQLDLPGTGLVLVATSGVLGEARSAAFDADGGCVGFRDDVPPALRLGVAIARPDNGALEGVAVFDLAVDAGAGVVYAATAAGLYRASLADASAWTRFGGEALAGPVHAVAVGASGVFGARDAPQDGGPGTPLVHLIDASGADLALDAFGESVIRLAVDPSDGRRVFAGGRNGRIWLHQAAAWSEVGSNPFGAHVAGFAFTQGMVIAGTGALDFYAEAASADNAFAATPRAGQGFWPAALTAYRTGAQALLVAGATAGNVLDTLYTCDAPCTRPLPVLTAALANGAVPGGPSGVLSAFVAHDEGGVIAFGAGPELWVSGDDGASFALVLDPSSCEHPDIFAAQFAGAALWLATAAGPRWIAADALSPSP